MLFSNLIQQTITAPTKRINTRQTYAVQTTCLKTLDMGRGGEPHAYTAGKMRQNPLTSREVETG